MENNGNSSGPKAVLVNELLEGRDLTKKLQLVFKNEPQYSINDEYGLLAKNILAKFERSLQILQYESPNPSQYQRVATGTTDSPNSLSGSPKSQDSDGDFKDPLDHKDESKKRRIHPQVKIRVQGSTSSGLESPIEDGYNWRKYGQKDILGAIYPRAYYRCTYRNILKCLATKQVQRADDDPGFFEVTYRGKHTCSQASTSSSSIPNNLITPKLEPTETLDNSLHQLQPHQPCNNIIWDFNRDNNQLEDIKPIINNNNHSKTFSFSFPCSSNTFLVADPKQIPTTMPNNYHNNFVSHGNIPTKTSNYTHHSPSSISSMIKTNFDDDHYPSQCAYAQEVAHPSPTTTTSSTAIAPLELPFDHQGPFDDDFIGNNPFFPH